VKEETTSNSCFVNTTCPSKFLLPEKGVTIEQTTKVRAKVQALVNGVTRNSNFFTMCGVVLTGITVDVVKSPLRLHFLTHSRHWDEEKHKKV